MEIKMSGRTPESALKAYKTITDKLTEMKEQHKADLAKLEATKAKIEDWLTENVTEYETPDWLFEINPSLNWTIGQKCDKLATATHMRIDDGVIPEVEQHVKSKLKGLKDTLESIESWALGELLKRGAKNFSTSEGTASIREDKYFSIADKALFVGTMIEKGAISELTVSVRHNSKAMQRILEEDGEYPAGLNVSRINKVVFTKK